MSKVLLATNNAWDRKRLLKVLQTITPEVSDVGADLLTALQICVKDSPKLCLVDLYLPPTTGLDALKKIIDMDLDEAPRLVLLSRLHNRAIIERALRLGARDVLTHPFSDEEFASTVAHYLY